MESDIIVVMQNEINDKEQEILKLLELDFAALKTELKDTADAIKKDGYSKYPVLLAHVQDLDIAEKIIDSNLHNSGFSYSASTLEELIEKGVILKERQIAFEEQFKANSDKYCILLIHPELMRFIFTPLK